MILGIVGSRGLTRKETYKGIALGLEEAKITTKDVTKIVTGDASGVDFFAAEWANSIGIKPNIKEAEWNNLEALPRYLVQRENGTWYNKLAGLNRNNDIVKESDILIAIQRKNQPTDGTNDSITKARKLNKTVYTIWV